MKSTIQRKTKVKKVRKTSRASLVRKLDKLVSEFIRQREPECVLASLGGCSGIWNNSHVFSRSNYSLRWDITEDGNCHGMCWGHNYRHEFDPYPYYRWYMNKFGQDKFDELHRQWRTVNKLSNVQLEAMITGIQSLLKPNRKG